MSRSSNSNSLSTAGSCNGDRLRLLAGICGLMSVSLFVITFILFAFLNPDFNAFSDFISELGSIGQPYGQVWNMIGFASVGLLLAAFGWLFGRCRNDRLLGACLVIAGFGFALGAIPTDFADAQSPLSKAHFASICISLAGYCCGLARLTGSQSTERERLTSNSVIALAVLPIVCVSGGVSAEPLAHRMILAIVFSWIVLTSLKLLRPDTTLSGKSANQIDGRFSNK